MEISFTPPKASEIKEEVKGDKIFTILIVIILFLLVLFVGLKIYNTLLVGKLSTIEEEIQMIEGEKDVRLEREMKEKMPLLNKAEIVLESHTRAANIFKLIEKKTFSDIFINSFNFNAQDNTVLISAESLNDKALAIQDSIFRKTPEIKSVEVGGISKTEGIFKFQFKLTLYEGVTNFSTKIK